MNSKIKKDIITQNNYICKVGYLQNKTFYNSVRNSYYENYDVGIPIQYCDVYILKAHPLTIAKEFYNCGINSVIVNMITENYSEGDVDKLDGVYDELLYLRTNFQCISKQNNNYFPPKENEVIYTPRVIVMRDEMLNLNKDIFEVSFITSTLKSPSYKILNYIEETDISSSENIDEDKVKKILSVDTYISVKTKIETILQTAYNANKKVVIFNDLLSILNDIPIDDLIDILNSCILKYAHLFKELVFGLTIKTPQDNVIYDMCFDKIIKPQNINLDSD